MEERGLLVRRQEGRANRLYLTEKGQRLRAETVPTQEQLIEGVFAALPRAEQATLLALLRRLDHSLG
jgi:DNA-binding MarR family transcriptional regulator